MAATHPAEWGPPPPDPRLPTGDVHLWLARVEDGSERDDILSRDERERARRFRFERDRRRWTGAHVLLRTVLGQYLAVAPADLVFQTTARERPVVARPDGAGWLHFNLSHAGALAIVAVARDREVGVDLEPVPANRDLVAIARRALGDDVAARLETTPEADRAQVFVHEWVHREARGKCLGTGLVEPEDEDREVACDALDLEIGAEYAGALAVRGRLGHVRRWSTTV